MKTVEESKKTITICTSASFFEQALAIEKSLKAFGFGVKLPCTALKMKKSGNFDVSVYKTWSRNEKDYARKCWLIKNHFRKIVRSDAILVLNYAKKEFAGYIGGNTLMEMCIAFHYGKPIYILNPIDGGLSYKEEVLGMQPIFLNGDLGRISH